MLRIPMRSSSSMQAARTVVLLPAAQPARVALFSAMSVCVFVCLSVNAITPEPLEISSRNFQSIILWSKWRTSSKMAV